MLPLVPGSCWVAPPFQLESDASSREDAHYRFGCSVAGLGDVDGDGTPDFLIGDPDGPGPGRVWLVSGTTGSTIYACTGHAAGDDFGWDLRAVGDVDGDGIADWITGADGTWRYTENGQSYASVHSGRDGKLLYLIRSDDPEEELGRCFAGAGDVDGDGREDFVIGAKRTCRPDSTGVAFIHSGRDGTRIRTLGAKFAEGTEAFDIASLGDCDGDGVPDTLVALRATSSESIESAVLFSGSSGEPIWIFRSGRDQTIRRVRPAGDVDGDGIPDAVVGCLSAVLILSGRDGCVIRRFQPKAIWETGELPHDQVLRQDAFGIAVTVLRGTGNARMLVVGADESSCGIGSVYFLDLQTGERAFFAPETMDGSLYHLGSNLDSAGDIDGDGCEDLLCGTFAAWGCDNGLALVYSGRDGRELRRFARRGDEVIALGKGEAPSRPRASPAGLNSRPKPGAQIHSTFGTSVSEIGDADGDGTPDLLVGEAGVPHGRVWLVSLRKRRALYSVPALSDLNLDEQIRPLGDVDGDGHPDWAQASACTVRVISGADGRLLHEFSSGASLPGQVDDSSVCGVGDLDHDGHADILIGTNRVGDDGRESGLASVRSGLDGHVLLTCGDHEPRGWLEIAVGAAGDVDLDGTPDIGIVCGEGPELKLSLAVYSGRTGELLRRVRDLPTNGRFRFKPCGDLDGDGRPDCIIASRGLVHVLFDCSRTNPLVLREDEIERNLRRSSGGAFGGGIACLRDATPNSQAPTLVVSDPDATLWVRDTETALWGGAVYFCSADDGSVRAVFSEDDADHARERGLFAGERNLPPAAGVHHLGSVLANLGDIDGDGYDDVACATENWEGAVDGQVFVLDGLRGKLLYELRRVGDDVRVLAARGGR
jgi:hypothetical protein